MPKSGPNLGLRPIQPIFRWPKNRRPGTMTAFSVVMLKMFSGFFLLLFFAVVVALRLNPAASLF